MTDNSNSGASAFSGAQNTQFSAAQNGNNTKDPLDYYYKEKGGKEEGPGFWSSFIFHEQVQAAEIELQYLNATKSDFGGTSVGVSDAKLRFLGIKSYGIIKTSFISLVLNLLIFTVLFNVGEQLLAFIFSLIFFLHVFFPGYVIYGMKRFTTENGRFTMKYFKKMKSIWRLFEILYLSTIVVVAYLTTVDFSSKIALLRESLTNKVFIKLFNMITSKVDLAVIQNTFKVYLLVLLVSFLVYIIVAYLRSKNSSIIQKEIEFEHNKEIKRPAELARIRMGKLK